MSYRCLSFITSDFIVTKYSSNSYLHAISGLITTLKILAGNNFHYSDSISSSGNSTLSFFVEGRTTLIRSLRGLLGDKGRVFGILFLCLWDVCGGQGGAGWICRLYMQIDVPTFILI